MKRSKNDDADEKIKIAIEEVTDHLFGMIQKENNHTMVVLTNLSAELGLKAPAFDDMEGNDGTDDLFQAVVIGAYHGLIYKLQREVREIQVSEAIRKVEGWL